MRSPLIMILCYVIGAFLIDWYIWSQLPRRSAKAVRGRRAGKYKKSTTTSSSGSRRGKTAYFIFNGFCWILLIISLCWPARDPSISILPKMWLIYAWLIIYAAKLMFVIFSLIGQLIQLLGVRRPVRLGIWAGIPVGIIVMIIMWWGAFVTRHEIMVNRVEIESKRLPKAFDGYKIAQISDLHVGTWGNDTTFISHLVDSVNALHPDLILFTGDIVNRHTPELLPFTGSLSRLKAQDGVISIMGNHDYGAYLDFSDADRRRNMEQLLKVQHSMGWNLIYNKHLFLHRGQDSIAIIGVENWGEPPFDSFGDLAKALRTPTEGIDSLRAFGPEYKILLSHNPEHWRRVVRHTSNIDLTLSGHTHAMQMMIKFGNFKWSPAVFRYPAWGGLYYFQSERVPKSLLYVNIGAGEVGMPFRIGATPEITLFTLHQ